MIKPCPYCKDIPNHSYIGGDMISDYHCEHYQVKDKSKKQAKYLWNKWVAEQIKILEHKASEKQGRLF